MAKRNQNIVQQQFGFPDEDLKTSLHDEIVLWLKQNALDLTKQITNWSEHLDTTQVQRAEDSFRSELEKLKQHLEGDINESLQRMSEEDAETESYRSFFRKSALERIEGQKKCLEQIKVWPGIERPPLRKIEVETRLEVPIIRERYKTFDIVGYADIVFAVSTEWPILFGLPKNESGQFKHDVDLREKTKWQMRRHEPYKIAFDAKSKIPSLGELVRQLNTYKSFCTWPFYVVCPDDRFATEISDEGFGFIRYPDGLITQPKLKQK